MDRFYGQWLGISAFVLQLCAGALCCGLYRFVFYIRSFQLVHLIAGAALTIAPSLRSGAIAFLLFKALDYSLFRAAKEILYIPLSFDARYRAKQVIDSFGYRFAKGGSAGVITVIGFAMLIPGCRFFYHRDGDGNPLVRDCVEFDKTVPESRDTR